MNVLNTVATSLVAWIWIMNTGLQIWVNGVRDGLMVALATWAACFIVNLTFSAWMDSK